MNGSTNSGAVGFNLEQAINTMESLNAAYGNLVGDLNCAFMDLALVIFYDGDGTEAWYAPEAVKFDNDVFLPAYKQLYDSVVRLFNAMYDRVKEGVKKWAVTTGTVVPSIPQLSTDNKSLHKYEERPRAKNTDNFGNIRISPRLIAEIKKAKTHAIEGYCRLNGETIKTFVRDTRTFLGADQQEAFSRNVNNMLDKIEKEVGELFDIAEREVQKSIEKYQAIAKQIASSFNN